MECVATRCIKIEQRQLEAEATVETLQHDITAVKKVFHSRMGATESGLEGLQENQQKLTGGFHAAETAIMDKMMAEVETCFVTKDQLEIGLSKSRTTHKVRLGAPEFVPLLSMKNRSLQEEDELQHNSCRKHPLSMDALRGMLINFSLRC